METGDDELEHWRDDFLADVDEEPLPDADAIILRAARDARDERMSMIGGIVATCFAVFVFFALVLKTRSTMFAVLASVVVPVLLALLAAHLRGRRFLRGDEGRSLASEVRHALERSCANHRVAKIGRVAMVFLTAAFWIWFPLLVVSRIERFAAEPSRVVSAVVAALVVFGAALWVTDRAVRKAAVEERRWRRIERSIAGT